MEGRVRGGVVALILVAISSSLVPVSYAQELKFGVTPMVGEPEARAEFEPLMSYLSSAIGRTVRLYVAKDYGDLQTRMETGVVDIGSFSPLAYVDAARAGKVRIIAQSILGGSATYRGLIIKRFDGFINSLADLEGKRFAFGDPKSASGYVYPRAMLIENGIIPERYFKETIFAGSHEKVIAAVLLGPAQAGATHDGAVALAKAKGLPTFDLEVLATTEPIPHDGIAVRVGLEDALVGKIQAALVELDRSPAGRQVIARSSIKLTGYVSADEGLYDAVRRAAKISGM